MRFALPSVSGVQEADALAYIAAGLEGEAWSLQKEPPPSKKTQQPSRRWILRAEAGVRTLACPEIAEFYLQGGGMKLRRRRA